MRKRICGSIPDVFYQELLTAQNLFLPALALGATSLISHYIVEGFDTPLLIRIQLQIH